MTRLLRARVIFTTVVLSQLYSPQPQEDKPEIRGSNTSRPILTHSLLQNLLKSDPFLQHRSEVLLRTWNAISSPRKYSDMEVRTLRSPAAAQYPDFLTLPHRTAMPPCLHPYPTRLTSVVALRLRFLWSDVSLAVPSSPVQSLRKVIPVSQIGHSHRRAPKPI